MNLIANIGRYLFAIPMVTFGVFHFVNTRSLQNVVPSFIPGQTFWVYLTGAALIASGLSILIKKQVQLTSNLLALMLLVFALFVHLPLALEGDQLASSSLLKDIALAGDGLGIRNYFKKFLRVSMKIIRKISIIALLGFALVLIIVNFCRSLNRKTNFHFTASAFYTRRCDSLLMLGSVLQKISSEILNIINQAQLFGMEEKSVQLSMS